YADADIALVTTNSICQGQQVARLWPAIFNAGMSIHFAVRSFKWRNLAAHNAGVTVIVVGLSRHPLTARVLYDVDRKENLVAQTTENINAYLVAGDNIVVSGFSNAQTNMIPMELGNIPRDGGHLFLTYHEREKLIQPIRAINDNWGGWYSTNKYLKLIRRVYGSKEFIRGEERYCLWIRDEDREMAERVPEIRERLQEVRQMRLASTRSATRNLAVAPHRFAEVR